MENLTADQKNRQLIRLLIDRRYRLWRHGAFLSGFLLLLFYKVNQSTEYHGIYRYYNLSAIFLTFNFMFYFNMYFLIPRFFFRAKYIHYLLILMLVVSLGLYVLDFISDTLAPHRSHDTVKVTENMGHPIWFIIAYAVILVTTTIKLFQRWTLDRESYAELKDLTLSMELESLKNQINPHFLFNMLNNVNVLIRKNPDRASMVVFKLSQFLRYQLYENQTETTPVSAEIGFLSNFLNLETIRRDNFLFTIETGNENLNSVFIPPNLFTTFVENAVKHSADISGGGTFVGISLKIDNGRLLFHCTNSVAAGEDSPNSEKGGLGLINIKRRLELLFDKNYRLDISTVNNQFIVDLEIPIN